VSEHLPPNDERPIMIYDGDCGFCRRWIARSRNVTGGRVEYLPYQTEGLLGRLGVSPVDAERAVQLVFPDGTRQEGAAAVFGALAEVPRYRRLQVISSLPVLGTLTEWVYRLVARNRKTVSKIL